MIVYILKKAIVILLHKNGLIYLKSYSQSVSLICILCKDFSKIHISNFIGDDIDCYQYGFINTKSKSDILESIDIIKEYLMEEDNGDIIYLDSCKVFVISLSFNSKIKITLGISKNNSKYCKILFNRTMKVKIGDNFSETEFTCWCSSRISTGSFVVLDIYKWFT